MIRVSNPQALICLFTLLLTSCTTFKTLEYNGLSNWKFKVHSLTQSEIAATVAVFNPNKYPIRIKYLEADVIVNGDNWGKYVLDSLMVLPALQMAQLPFSMRIKNGQLINAGLAVASGNTIPYTLQGKIKGGRKTITAVVPFLHSGTLSDKDIKL